MHNAKKWILGVLLVGAIAIAAPPTATGIWLDPSIHYAFTNCEAAGSAVQVIPNGKYMVQVSDDEAINVVYGTTYDGGSDSRPKNKNLAYLESFFADDGGTALACQSSGGTGDLDLTGTH